ncbi:MAG: hypothetical protein HFH48_03010 [Lachnospiraceae bacterium]|nr:hypothetical protein [Lachnospiraceae bacterium]
MTDKLSELLKYIQKTNPSMDRKRLIEELSKCRYSAVALVMVCENDRNILQNRKSMVY